MTLDHLALVDNDWRHLIRGNVVASFECRLRPKKRNPALYLLQKLAFTVSTTHQATSSPKDEECEFASMSLVRTTLLGILTNDMSHRSTVRYNKKAGILIRPL